MPIQEAIPFQRDLEHISGLCRPNSHVLDSRHSISESAMVGMLRKHYAAALLDARHRKANGDRRAGKGFGDGWTSAISGVECYVFILFGVEMASTSTLAPLCSTACLVMITDPGMTKLFHFGRGFYEVGWECRRRDSWPDPLHLFTAAYADALSEAQLCGDFVWRRDLFALLGLELSADDNSRPSVRI